MCNQQAAGGQSVPHLHIHLIPRNRGDKEYPRGGVLGVAGQGDVLGVTC